MQEEFYPAAEKILLDIHQIFIKDPRLKSFEVIPMLQHENKSPIHVEDHCLGLESWCVPHIYCYAYKTLMDFRQTKGKVREAEKCNSLLIGVLLLNPDITTLWNMRKELIHSGKLDPFFELHFTSVILTFKPKCADIYAFRKWVLKRIMLDSSIERDFLQKEMEICEAAADRYSNNYHAWTHRIWCLGQSLSGLLQQEWLATARWAHRHVSDYSGFHYRQKLITFLLTYIKSPSYDPRCINQIILCADEVTDRFLRDIKNLNLTLQIIPLSLRILINEFVFNSDLIWNFIGHESLWCHRRFIFYEMKKVLFEQSYLRSQWGYYETSNHSTVDGMPVEKTQKIDLGSLCDEFCLVLSFYEYVFLEHCSEKYDHQQMLYADRHKQWLTKFSNFQLPFNNDMNNFNVDLSSLLFCNNFINTFKINSV